MRRLLHMCQVCCRHKGDLYSALTAPSLPQIHTTADFPFPFTGVGFARPLYFKDGNASSKGYIALFTSGVTCTIHLDLVPDLAPDMFLR